MDPEEYKVHGTVMDADGQELSGAEVSVWWQRIRERLLLVEGDTSEEGHYHLSYRPPDDAPGKLLIVVEVHSEHLDAPLESPLTPAQPDLQIDLEAQPPDRAEFTTLVRAIEQQLDGLSLLDVVENDEHQDISFLAQETGNSKEQIMRVVVSARLRAVYNLPAAAFYAFLRLGVPASLPASLLEASQGFTLIDSLVLRVASLIFALTRDVQERTLAAAVQNQLVSRSLAEQIPLIVDAFQSQRVTNILDQPYLAGKTTLGQLLDVASLAESKRAAFAQALIQNTETMEKFWTSLADGKHGFTLDEVAAVRRTLSIGAFVKNTLPLISTLSQGFAAGTYSALPDLAKLTEKDWLDLITASGPGTVPANIAGSDPTATFAHEIYDRVTAAYPTAALAARVGGSTFVPENQQAPLQTFFTNNAVLDLRRQNLDIYLNQAGEAAFTGIAQEDRPGVMQNLRAIQRVLRIVPHVDTCEKLLSLGLHSAAAITMMGKQQFVAKLETAGATRLDAYKTYALARTRYAGVISLYTQFNRSFIGLWPKALGPLEPDGSMVENAIEQNPTLAVLFGPQDYCQVDDCTSILSPAAYLTDLLLWLSNRTSGITGFPNAFAVLNARRPDLGNLLLNCPNTNTPLPYIDVVNELLADTITPPSPAAWRQTTLSAAELRAALDPANANPATDAKLRQASYPHTLPYDTALDQLRTVLAQSNVALWQLRQAFLPLHGTPPQAQMESIASERFGINEAERTLITTANAVPLSTAWNTPNPVTDLAPVNVFLSAADLAYEQLLELVDVVWARGGGAALTIQGADDTCNTSAQTITPLESTRLDLMHRFLRLWRRTGWKMWELDLLLSSPATGDPALSPATLVNLFTLRLLQDATGLTVDQLLAFYQDIDTASHRDPDGTTTTPLYAALFLNPALTQDPDLALNKLDGTADLATHAPAIQAALQVSATDVATLIALTDNHRTLDNLSLVYRVAILARALRLSLSDLLAIGPQPVTGVFATPAVTRTFVQRASAIARAGFSVDQLQYVLTTTPARSGITDAQVTSVLTDVVHAIQTVQASVYGSGDPPFTVLGRQFAQLPPSSDPSKPSLSDPGQLQSALSIVDGSFTGGDPARTTFINSQFALFMTPAELAQAVATLTPQTPPASGAQLDTRANLVLAPLARYLTQTQVIAAVADDLALAADVTAYLMRTLNVPHLPPTSETLLAALTDLQLLSQPLTPTGVPDAFNAIRLLHKLSIITGRLHLVLYDLTWLVANASVYGGVDLANLPVLAGQTPQAIDALLATVLLVQLNRSFTALAGSTVSPPPAIASLTDLITAVSTGSISDDSHAQAAFAGIAGVAQDDVQALASTLGIALAAGDWTRPATFDRLRTLLAMARATGGSGAALASWGIEVADESAAAASALLALKSRYANEVWLTAAPALNDPLRERRRDAMVAYLTAQRDASNNPLTWGADSNSLFDYLLIDTQMSACQDTSRVVQAYETVQLFVERCLMNLEPAVAIDTTADDGWLEWDWRKRYRLWQADREIFLWPENWLIEADRPNRSELFDKLEQETRQTPATADALETIALNYIDRLDQIAHLLVTGMCVDPVTQTVHVVARTHTDPPRYYHRTFANNAWSPWVQIPLDIKAHQVVPAVHRRSLYLFWAEVKLANEPQQTLPPAQASSTPSQSRQPGRHAEIRIASSAWRNNHWTTVNYAPGVLYDAPLMLLDPQANATSQMVEALYSLKVNLLTSNNRSDLYIEVFRFLDYKELTGFIEWLQGTFGPGAQNGEISVSGDRIAELFQDPKVLNLLITNSALHIGRAIFDGRFDALEMRDTSVIIGDTLAVDYLAYAQQHYGMDAEKLTQLADADADPELISDSGLLPKAGALVTQPIGPGGSTSVALNFTSTVSAQEQNVGPLLDTAQAPFVVVGPSTDLQFDPANDFVYSDPWRAYYVQSTPWYEYGSQWRPVVPSNPADTPFQVRYYFHRFYHPYTRLFWHEIFNGGLPALYSPTLQASPATVDPSGGDTFSFQATYQPEVGRVSWGEDGEIIDFSRDATYSVYNWELFFHVPLYIAQQLRQNQQFEDALAWLQYIFNPTAPGPLPAPQRYWVTAPFTTYTTAQAAQQSINNILMLVDQSDPNALAAVKSWQQNPFNPFLVADQRPVAYMKAVVMEYVETLIAWADNLFASASRENLSQATLLLVRASEILGTLPQAVPPPARADASFNQLQSSLDDFANTMVQIENVLPPGGMDGNGGGGPLPPPQTFYFKIPPNEQLLNYWSIIADRLFKLRHCLSITGQPLLLPLFDAPLDPGLLAAAEAAGVDLSSILSDVSAPLPNYRYDVLYAQAQKFCAAVRGYGAQLLAALEKRDADQLALLLPTLQQQLLVQQNQIYQWQVDAANEQIAALEQAIAVQQLRNTFYTTHATQFTNDNEQTSISLQNAAIVINEVKAAADAMVAIAYLIPEFQAGASGFGGTPVVNASEGGKNLGHAAKAGADLYKTLLTILEQRARLAKQLGDYRQRADRWNEQAQEAQFEIQRLTHEHNAANFRLQIAQQQQVDHQTAIDNLQQQIDFLTNKFTSTQLYDWMAGKLSAIYFQSYRLAYAMAKRAERCYQYELALPNASFIQFGYWDSLYQGLLAGEGLANDLHQMHSSYLDLNVRRYEISNIFSLARLNPVALLTLLQTGSCDFTLPETLFDTEYSGHYQRQLKRVSITVVYPNPGKNDNVSCTLTLVQNKLRMNTTLNAGAADPYAENPVGNDPRFAYQYGAVQSIVTSQAQDDPGLFENQVHYQITDPRYLPFEGAGAISDWHMELPSTNDIDITTVGDVLIHVLYTALDGGPDLKTAAIASLANAPQNTTKLFSAVNDFPVPSNAPPGTLSAWQSFFAPPAGSDQLLTLPISAAKFPPWTRGKTITVQGLTVYALSWTGAAFVLEPQAPLPGTDVTLTPVGGTPSLVAANSVAVSTRLKPGTWSFKLRLASAGDFRSLTSSQIGDLVLKIDFTAA